VNVTANSGTTPTLDMYLQGSYDGQTWIDLASSAQWTTTNNAQIFGFTAQGAIHSAAFTTTDATLAASTTRTVVIPSLLRLKWKLGGTTPSYTFVAKAQVR